MSGFQVIHLNGCLGLNVRIQLDEILEKVGSGCPFLRLDLSRVDEVDLSGLSWLMIVDARLKQSGGRLDIVAASPAARRALTLLRPASQVMHMGSRRKLTPRGLPHTPPKLLKVGC